MPLPLLGVYSASTAQMSTGAGKATCPGSPWPTTAGYGRNASTAWRGAGRAVGPDVIEYWSETANGLIWEIDELEAEDVPDADELADAVEAFVDELLAQPLASPGEEPRDGGPPAY